MTSNPETPESTAGPLPRTIDTDSDQFTDIQILRNRDYEENGPSPVWN